VEKFRDANVDFHSALHIPTFITAIISKMGFEERLAMYETEEIRGQALVRRFTNNLAGDTELEHALRDEQEENDRLMEADENEQFRSMYERRGRDDSYGISDSPKTKSNHILGRDFDFHSADFAREKLQESCRLLEANLKPSRVSRFGISSHQHERRQSMYCDNHHRLSKSFKWPFNLSWSHIKRNKIRLV
jgi:hypothetical protein